MKKLLISLAFPLLVLVGLVTKNEFDIRTNERFFIEIEGYDPRDILRGHYIEFRYKWDFDKEKTREFEASRTYDAYSKEDFLCIMSNYKVFPILKTSNWGQCKYVVKGRLNLGNIERPRFTLGLERFYVPEKYAKILEDQFRIENSKSKVEVVVNAQQRVVLIDLILNGRSWKKIIKDHQKNERK